MLDEIKENKTKPTFGRACPTYDDSRIKKRIAKNKKKILKALTENFGMVTIATAKVNIGNLAFYRYYKEDQEFAKAVDEIQDSFDAIVEDKLKQKIIQNDGHSIRFYLSHRVKKYRPKMGLGGDDDVEPIKLIITEYKPK